MQQHAIASYRGLPVTDAESIVDVSIDVQEPGPHDVRIRPEAVSVNPADVKVRAGLRPSSRPRILGFDGAGTVEAVGSAVTTLAVGDEVWWAGQIDRPGSNQDLQLVDERIVARKPTTLDWADAAALPLTTITAWETLFDRFHLTRESTGTLVVVGGAGGVGSIMIQLAKRLTGVRVIATASRSESADFARSMGADAVVDHRDLVAELAREAPDGVRYLFTAHSAGRERDFAQVLQPFGEVAAIDDPRSLDIVPFKAKSLTWHWELMFTRPVLRTPDMIEQQRLLTEMSALVDSGALRSTRTRTIEGFNAASMRAAHQAVESNGTIGKVVVAR